MKELFGQKIFALGRKQPTGMKWVNVRCPNCKEIPLFGKITQSKLKSAEDKTKSKISRRQNYKD